MVGNVILFDGVCNFCNGAINFVLKRDRAGAIRFAPLQSGAAAELLRRHGLPPSDLDSMVLIEDGHVYKRSAAALRVAWALGLPWSLLYALVIVPRPIRDAVYDLVARNRYRWFGKRSECMVPTAELRGRFLP